MEKPVFVKLTAVNGSIILINPHTVNEIFEVCDGHKSYKENEKRTMLYINGHADSRENMTYVKGSLFEVGIKLGKIKDTCEKCSSEIIVKHYDAPFICDECSHINVW